MPASITSMFSDAEDFEAALGEEGCLSLLVTGVGPFQAQLTEIALHRLRLSATDEHLPRITLVTVPAEMILVSLPSGSGAPSICGGLRLGAREILTLGAGKRLHMRTDGPCCWSAIWVPVPELVRYGSALTGANFHVPTGARWWRPRPAMGKYLGQLHSAAIRAIERRSIALIGAETAHGLEQQLIEALVECFSKGSEIETPITTNEHQDVACRFEALLHAQPNRHFRMAEICAALDVPTGVLRLACEEQLGMGPTEYVSRRQMQLVHRALLNGGPGPANIYAIARRYRFRSLGRFAVDYRAIYGELPSETLRRSPGQGMGRLRLRRRRRRA
jgi:AraC-like DNA-binding protein